MDQFYFGTPFASLGDQTVFPIATDPNGYVSFQQGWGPDYALDPDTDANAKPIDRASTNWLMYVLTQAVGALQLTGIPQWITPSNNNGVAVAYPKYSQVRYSATSPGVVFATYISVIDNNTDVPGETANWQPILSIAAQAADVNSATPVATLTVTPAALQAYAGNASQTFLVATATASGMATNLGQVQGMLGQSSLLGSYSASATLTASGTNPCLGGVINFTGSTASQNLTLPSKATMTTNGTIRFHNIASVPVSLVCQGSDAISVNSGANVTSIILQPGDDITLLVGSAANAYFAINGSALRQYNPLTVANATSSQHALTFGQFGTMRGFAVYTSTAGTNWTVPAGVTQIYVTGGGGGGGGGAGGTSTTTTNACGGGGGGGGASGITFYQAIAVTPGDILQFKAGTGGAGGTSGTWGNAGNPGSPGTSSTITDTTTSTVLYTSSYGGYGNGGTYSTTGVAAGGGLSGLNNGSFGQVAVANNSASGMGGNGGSSPFGGGGGGGQLSNSGSQGVGYCYGGAGGGGNVSGNNNGGAGQPGGNGVLIVNW